MYQFRCTDELRSHLKEYIELLVKSNILDQPDTTLRFVLAKDYHTSGGIDEHFYDWDEIVADLETYNPLLTIPMICKPNGDIYWCLCLDGESGKIGNYKEKLPVSKYRGGVPKLLNQKDWRALSDKEISYLYSLLQ